MPQDIEKKISDILYSGQLAYGSQGRSFETALQNYIQNPLTLSVATYNHAVLLALSVLDLKHGDEIIASPVSCLASNQPFAVKGLKIQWADIDPNSGTVDTESIRKLINKNTKAIFNNLFCGYAGELEEVYKLGKEFGIPVIDDCIEAFGTVYKGKKTGATGADISVFSFQTVRLPNTIDGGALSFTNPNLFEKAVLMRDYGIDRSNFRTADGEINPECDIELEGYGATMNELSSFIGLEQMSQLAELLDKQRKNALQWDTYFSDAKDVKILNTHKDVNPNYWVYGILAKDKKNFTVEMRSKGFYATGVHINNNIYSVFNNKTSLPGVTEFMNSFVALPCGWWTEIEL